MKCDDFLPSLETGGFLARRAARRHAVRCARCAAAAAALAQLKRSWSDEPPLTSAQRDAWLSAAGSEVERACAPSLRWRRYALAGVGCAAAILVALALWPKHVPVPAEPGGTLAQQIDVTPARVEVVDPAAELEALAAEIAKTQAEVEALLAHVEIVTAHRQAEEMLAYYKRW